MANLRVDVGSVDIKSEETRDSHLQSEAATLIQSLWAAQSTTWSKLAVNFDRVSNSASDTGNASSSSQMSMQRFKQS